jgi:hypothetical protein
MKASLAEVRREGRSDPDETLARITASEQLAAGRPDDRGDYRGRRREGGALQERRRRGCLPEAILASNTKLDPDHVARCGDPPAGAVIGMHFFNPVPVLKLVEVIRAADVGSDRGGHRDARARAGKEPAEANDYPWSSRIAS